MVRIGLLSDTHGHMDQPILDALVECGLARRVQLEHGAARFCPNMEEHCHYYCGECGAVFDVPLGSELAALPCPKGFKVEHHEIAVHGCCAECAKRKKQVFK